MKRRAFLGSLAASCAGALAGCGERSVRRGPATETETPGVDSQGEGGDADGAWKALQQQFGFERRVDAVADLGWDRTGNRPVDPSLERSFERDVLVQVPPGTYKLSDSVVDEDLTNWGLVGLGADRGDVEFTTNEGARIEFKVLGGRDVLLHNFTFQQGQAFDRTMGMTFFVDDNLRVSNVEIAGANPTSNPSGVTALALSIVDPSGSALVDGFVRAGPQVFEPYPRNELCVFSGRTHRGTVTYRNLHIENAGENGIYASKCPGEVHVEGGFYRNNRNDNIRISGTGSYVRDVTVVIDSDNFHPRNRGVEGNMRGIRMQSGDQGFTGGVIEDSRLELRSSFVTQALVMIAHNQGGMTMRNSELRNWTEYHTFRAEAPSDHVTEPWGVTLEDVRAIEHGRRGSAIEIENRPNSTLRNVTVETGRASGGRHGIVIAESNGTVFEDVDVRTNGIPLWIKRPSTAVDDYHLRFEGENAFRLENNLFGGAPATFTIGRGRTFYPFRDVGDDVDAVFVTGANDESIQFESIPS